MAIVAPTKLKELTALVRQDEGKTLEFKRSTGELREDRPLIPPDAMREILVNALIHRDYSNAGGAVYLAIYDDRVEVWSTGTFPEGITPAMLSREHKSILRNPIIADVFHRAGLIEKWGRGTNRVIEMCRKAGIRSPEFHEVAGAAVAVGAEKAAQAGGKIGRTRIGVMCSWRRHECRT